MISFQDLMQSFGVVTVMNACIYKLKDDKNYRTANSRSHYNGLYGLTPSDFECTHLYLDTLKISNINQEGANKTISGGSNNEVLFQYGKTMTLEMNSALGSAEILTTFFGCEVGSQTNTLYVTNKFSSSFAIEGDTIFIDQKTGQKVNVHIFIPQFRPNGVFNLTQDSEGDAAVFDCSGTIFSTRIVDIDYPQGHEIFYLISDKSWVNWELYPTATITYKKISSSSDLYALTSHMSGWEWSWRSKTSYPCYVVTGIDDDQKVAIIPNTYDGLPVIAITIGAGSGTQIEEVYLSQNIQVIDSLAFCECSKLRHINIPENSHLWFLGAEAFENTTLLTNVQLPASVTYISDKCFHNSGASMPCASNPNWLVVDDWVVGRVEGATDIDYFPTDYKKVAEGALNDINDITNNNSVVVSILNKNSRPLAFSDNYCTVLGWTYAEEYVISGAYHYDHKIGEYTLLFNDTTYDCELIFQEGLEMSYPGCFVVEYVGEQGDCDLGYSTVSIKKEMHIEPIANMMLNLSDSPHIHFDITTI